MGRMVPAYTHYLILPIQCDFGNNNQFGALLRNTELLTHPQYRADIDGLRAIAVLSIVGFHVFPLWVKGGFIGVDIFFVISGFLISTIIVGSLERNDFSFVAFYSRRIKRIFPALLVVLIACYAFGWFALLADEFKQLGKHIAGGAGFFSNFLFWQESGYFDNSAETKPLLHLWSLGIEEQFYIIWPLVLWISWKFRFNLLAITMAIALVSFALNIGTVMSGDTVAAFFSPQTRIWELLVGSVLAQGTRHGQIPLANFKAGRHGLSWLGVLLIASGLLVMTKARPFPGWWAAFPTLGTALIISAGPQAWPNRVLLANRLLVWFGLISFPLYLWHWPLLSFARIVESETPADEIRIAAVLISCALAWLTYQLIEKPIRTMRTMRTGRHSKAITIALLASMIATGYVGYNSYARDGLKFRAAGQVALLNKFGPAGAPYKQSCDFLTGEQFIDDWCNPGSGKTANPGMVLIGDSIANTYTTMFAAYQSNHLNAPGFIQFGRGQCPPLNDYGPDYCRQITAREFDYISKSGIKTVVLAASWPAYFNGKDFTYWKHKESAEAFKLAFEKTIRQYQSGGKRIVVLLATPQGPDPKSCVVRPFKLTDKNACNLPRASATNIDGHYREYLIPFLQAEHIAYFDPFPYFCDSTTCRITDGNKILYIDGGHFSVFGGEFLARNGKSRLDELFLDGK